MAVERVDQIGIKVRILATAAWLHDLVMALAGAYEGGSTMAAYKIEDSNAAVVTADATLVALEVPEIE